jgi:hypothetical protein
VATKMSTVQRFFFYCIAPVACSIVIGFIFFRGQVFDGHHPASQFLWSSIIAAAFYYLLVLAKSRDAYLGLLLLAFLLIFLVTRSMRPALVLRDILAVAAIGLSILLYFRYSKESAHLRYLYPPLILAGVYGVVNLVAAEINLLILAMFPTVSLRGNYLSVAAQAVFYGVLIGFAVGCGFALNDKFAPIRTDAGAEAKSRRDSPQSSGSGS